MTRRPDVAAIPSLSRQRRNGLATIAWILADFRTVLVRNSSMSGGGRSGMFGPGVSTKPSATTAAFPAGSRVHDDYSGRSDDGRLGRQGTNDGGGHGRRQGPG